MRWQKRVVITGASPDFGLTLALAYAQQGAELFLSALTLEESEQTAAAVRAAFPGARVHSFGCDLRSSQDVARFAQGVRSVTDAVELVINNGSFWVPGRLAENSQDQICDAISSTFTGTVLVSKHFLPLLKAAPEADVVNLVARCGQPHDRHATSSEAFSAAKSGQSVFGDHLRQQLRGTGIRVIQIYPPNFNNTSILDKPAWNARRAASGDHLPSARNVFDAIQFALGQDRRCSIDEITLSNVQTDVL